MNVFQNILVVDDQSPNRLVIKETLSNIQVNIEEAENGLVALEMIKKNEYALIILDIIMPEMNGIQVLKEIKKIPEKSNIPVILLTAKMANDDDIIEGIEAGAFDYLQKPFISEVLIGKIELFLKLDDHHRKLQHLVEKLEKANYETRISEYRFRKVSSHAAEGIILFNNSGLINYINKAAQKVFGYSQEELNNDHLSCIIGNNKDEIDELLKSYYENFRSRIFETIGNTKNGRQLLLEISLSGFKMGKDYYGIIICRDITKRKKDEKELLKAKEYKESNKLMNDFLGKLNHELRTPLNAVIGISNILLKDKKNFDEKQQQGLQLINDNGNQLFRIIENLLFVGEKPKINITEIEVKQYAERMSNYFNKFNSNNNLKFKTNISDRMPGIIHTDKDLLDSVIFNLLDNAKKFTKEGYISLTFDYSDSTINILVSDTGIGINENDLKTIFNRFQQLEEVNTRNYGGIGLGLTVVQNTVKKSLCGDIEIHSEINKGTTIKIVIPDQHD